MNYPMNHTSFTITLEQLLADITNAEDTAQSVSEANGEHRANIKGILEERGYHKKAFADFRAMHAMSDEKFADYWRTFKACVDAYEGEAESRIQDLLDRKDAETDGMSAEMAAEE
jgi:hypothetical protein